MYNISLKDELLKETRRSFDSEAAMDAWLQQQVEALLVSYNASQQAARRKARLDIVAMRRQSEENGNAAMTLDDINNEIRQASTVTTDTRKNIEITPRVQRFKRGNPWHISDEELDRLRYEYLTEKYR